MPHSSWLVSNSQTCRPITGGSPPRPVTASSSSPSAASPAPYTLSILLHPPVPSPQLRNVSELFCLQKQLFSAQAPLLTLCSLSSSVFGCFWYPAPTTSTSSLPLPAFSQPRSVFTSDPPRTRLSSEKRGPGNGNHGVQPDNRLVLLYRSFLLPLRTVET